MSILKRTFISLHLHEKLHISQVYFHFSLTFHLWIFNYLFANNEYYYKNLTVNADIQQDWTIQVNEIFDAYFNIYKHGIIRNIPLKYTINEKKFRIFLENIRVEGRNASVYENNGEKEIKIWDADRELIWNQRYSIHYSVYGLIRNFAGKGREELSWNVIPNGFDTHIDHVRIELNLPKSYTWFTSEDFLIAADGKSNKLEDFEGTIDWSQGDKIILTYDKTILEWNGITIAMKFPVGYFTFDHKKQESLIDKEDVRVYQPALWLDGEKKNLSAKEQEEVDTTLKHVCYLFIGVFILACIGLPIRIIYGKVPEDNPRKTVSFSTIKSLIQKDPIVVVQYYPPEGMTSAEAWALFFKNVRTLDLCSLIYQWALDRLVSLEYRDSDLIVTKQRDLHSEKEYESDFFSLLFKNWETVTINSEHKIKIGLVLNQLEKYLEKKKWIKCKGNMSIEHRTYLWFLIRFALWFLIVYYVDFIGRVLAIWLAVGLCFGGILAFIFLWNSASSPQLMYLEDGERLMKHLLWYREFLRKCEVEKLKSLLVYDPLYIDKALVYATVFWLETEVMQKLQSVMQANSLFFRPEIFESLSSIRSSWDFFDFSNYHSLWALRAMSSSSSYDRSSWFSSGSSFSSHSSSGRSWGGWWWGGGRSW